MSDIVQNNLFFSFFPFLLKEGERGATDGAVASCFAEKKRIFFKQGGGGASPTSDSIFLFLFSTVIRKEARIK